MNLKVSVIIPTYKRPLLLRRCLAALAAQDFDKRQYEIIVVSDGKDEATQKAVEHSADYDYPGIRYLVSFHAGPSKARNRGWREAEGEIIAFTDDDTIPDSNWLKKGVKMFNNPMVDAVSGEIIVPTSEQPTDYEQNTARLAEAEFVTANCFMRKKVLEQIGGFDERFKTAWREDSDLEFKLLERHKNIIRENQAVVIHPVRQAPWGVSIKEQKKSMYNALLYKNHPDLYREKIQSSAPWQYYIIIVSFILFPFESFNYHYFLSIILLSIWMTFTFLFFIKRIKLTSHSLSHIMEMAITSLIIPFLSVFWRLYGAIRYRVFFF